MKCTCTGYDQEGQGRSQFKHFTEPDLSPCLDLVQQWTPYLVPALVTHDDVYRLSLLLHISALATALHSCELCAAGDALRIGVLFKAGRQACFRVMR